MKTILQNTAKLLALLVLLVSFTAFTGNNDKNPPAKKSHKKECKIGKGGCYCYQKTQYKSTYNYKKQQRKINRHSK